MRTDAEGRRVAVPPRAPQPMTDMGWEVFPEALRAGLLRIQRDYGPRQIYITENGAAYDDPMDESGRIRDPRRIAYLQGHLAALAEAIAAGIPVGGYFLWSLLDNFEWAYGYAKKFGLFALAEKTRDRIPRDSAFWYRDLVSANAVASDAAPNLHGDSRAIDSPQ
jgi:beta-glucosidase